MSMVLIIDDDRTLLKDFRRLLSDNGYTVATATSGPDGLSLIQTRRPDIVLLEVCLPGMNGLEVYERIRELAPDLPAIIMTAFGSTDTAIQATKLGAFEYVLKPFDLRDVMGLIDQALEEFGYHEPYKGAHPGLDMPSMDAIIGQSRSMIELYKAIGRVASTNATVLIRGESGTGKELVARAIHHYSKRSSGPFQVIDCTSIPENLLESELFGYEKGAFTGATQRHAGHIERAQGGTVLLDEIGDMPLNIQAKILRLLQEKHFQPLGGTRTVAADVRIIAATNRDLEKALAAHRFREDLYYRLKVVTLTLPPLRERADDIPLLSEYLLRRLAQETGIANPGIWPLALEVLARYEWPGNVRELANTLYKALIFSRGCRINPDTIAQAISGGDQPLRESGRWNPEPAQPASLACSPAQEWIGHFLETARAENPYACLMEQYSRLIVHTALEMSGGNRSRAAQMLGISRQTVISKIGQ